MTRAANAGTLSATTMTNARMASPYSVVICEDVPSCEALYEYDTIKVQVDTVEP